MLRGGFGHAFRRLCCIPQCRDAHSCPIGESCPYKQIFEPSPPPGAERLSRNQDIPRPFIFRPPHSNETHFKRDESFEFELVLIGRAFEYLPYFVLSFRELAEGGLGLNRARCTLDRVWSAAICRRFGTAAVDPGTEGTSQLSSQQFEYIESGDMRGPRRGSRAEVLKSPHSKDSSIALIYSAEDQLFRSVKPLDSSDWIESRISQLTSDLRPLISGGSQLTTDHRLLTIHFLTPTHLKSDGQVIREPEFHHIFKRLRDRLNALSTFFGDGPLEVDFRALGERSEKIKKVAGQFQWLDRTRTSSKTGQRHELSGFVGEATYEGELEEFLPWLVMGELVHVGKHTAWGNGRFVVKSQM